MHVLLLLSVFLTSGCVTKLLTRLPKEKAAVVVKYINEAENHYQTTAKHYTHLDALYEQLFNNMDEQYILQLSSFKAFSDMARENHTAEAIKKVVEKINGARELNEEKAAEIQKVVDLLEADLNIIYNKAVQTHYDAKNHAKLYWFDEKTEENQRKKNNAFSQARAYERQARKQRTYATSWIQKSKENKNIDLKDSLHTYLEYFHNMKKAFQSYREATEYGLLEIQHRRQELKRIREVRI